MPQFPAFESALASGDHEALLRLYTSALAQRDRAEAQIRALLNPQTSTHSIGLFHGVEDLPRQEVNKPHKMARKKQVEEPVSSELNLEAL